MSKQDEYQFSLGGMLTGVAAVAVLFALLLDRRLVTGAGKVVALCCLGWLILMAAGAVVEGMLGVSCPSCRVGRMKRVALSNFGFRYFRCGSCGERWKKGLFTDWAPVDEHEDAVYDRKTSADPWSLPPGMTDDEAVVWSETHTSLLQNKQARNPNAIRQEKQKPIR